MIKVAGGIGHGGSDPGAVANGLREADINLVVGVAYRDELVRHEVSVYLTRVKDENDTLRDEIDEINKFGPVCAVDMHENAGGGDGAEIYCSINPNGKGKKLGEFIEAEIIALGQNSRGVKTRINNSDGKDYYGFIRETKCPAVIVEGAFIDNSADVQFIDTIEEQKALGVAIAHGVLKYLEIDVKPVVDYGTLYKDLLSRVNNAIQILS